MNPVLLSANQLSCERGGVPLFGQLDFSLSAGEIVQIVGPNGSGKTTLLRILATLSSEYEGMLQWQGKDFSASGDEYLAKLLYLGHKPAIKTVLTPLENLRWYARENSDGEIIAALERWQLRGYEHQPCHQLSAGQQQRVALTRLLLSKAPVWLLDEPFTAIDQGGVVQLENLLIAHAEKGGSVILTTHHIFRPTDHLRFVPLQQVTA